MMDKMDRLQKLAELLVDKVQGASRDDAVGIAKRGFTVLFTENEEYRKALEFYASQDTLSDIDCGHTARIALGLASPEECGIESPEEDDE